MWINALTVYELQLANPETWSEAFAEHPADDPPIGMRDHLGFAHLELAEACVDVVDDQYAFVVVISERVLPKDAIEREVKRRMSPADQADEEKARSSWVEVEAELLGRAPVREKRVPAVYDSRTQRLYVFSGSSVAESAVLTAMRNALGSLHAIPMIPREPVGMLLTRWMKEGAAPTPFLLGRSCELQSEEDTNGRAAFKNRDLSIAEIRQHLERGDKVSKLSLLWNGKLEFALTAKGEIKSIAPPECKMKPALAFTIWPEIMGVLPGFFSSLMEGLGGSLDAGELMKVEERPARVAVLATGGKEDMRPLVTSLDGVLTKRKIGEVVIPALSEPLMRRVYSWAQENSIKVTLIKPAPEKPKELAKAVMKAKPKGLLIWGQCERIDALVEAAVAKDVKPYQLRPRAAA